MPFRAETGVQRVSPPQSSGAMPRSWSCCFTRSILAPGASILLMATTIGTLAFCANFKASSVWSLNPSSAATTKMAISVMAAPRCLILEKAAWPGVSMKVILCSLWLTW